MASLFDLEDSSDSDDFDYEPVAAEELSSDDEPVESSDDEKETSKKSRNKAEREKKGGSKVVLASAESKPSEKQKADDIYKIFLDEVERERAAEKMKESRERGHTHTQKSESVSSGISCSESVTSSPVVLSVTSSPVVLNTEKSSCTSSEKLFEEFSQEKISVFDDNVKSVERESDSLSHTASISDSKKIEKAASTAVAPPLVKRKGLDSVLGMIENKKQKMTVLEKTAADWRSFKEEQDINEELQQFNRGRGGFIERQRFLERSDVRSYEIERDMRLSKRPTQPKRDT